MSFCSTSIARIALLESPCRQKYDRWSIAIRRLLIWKQYSAPKLLAAQRTMNTKELGAGLAIKIVQVAITRGILCCETS